MSELIIHSKRLKPNPPILHINASFKLNFNKQWNRSKNKENHCWVNGKWDAISSPLINPSHAPICGKHPFRFGVIPNLFENDFLKSVKQELLEQTFFHKSNDLYEFLQSESLKLSTSTTIQSLVQQLYSPDFISTMSSITGIQLNSVVDISCARYPQNGYLLCHDDDISDGDGNHRRIAFICYLNEEWKKDDGGLLQLYDKKSTGDPCNEPCVSILPVWNSFAFFEVSPNSWHRVQEVLKVDERVSVSGWFHGDKIEIKPPTSTPHAVVLETSTETYILGDYINSLYLNELSIKQIRDQFIETSCIDLKSFLLPSLHKQTLAELTGWELTGPPSIKSYYQTKKSTRLDGFLKSVEFHDYISKLTDTKTLPSKQLEKRKFTHGCYTLLHDGVSSKSGLDVFLQMTGGEENEIVYVAGKETLIKVSSGVNTLSLVLRDEGVMRFVKYFAKRNNDGEDKIDFELVFDE